MQITIRRLETFSVLVLFTAIFAFIYPDLFFFNKSPMGGDIATLKDPTVSWSEFIPSFREFRYQLLEHGNMLWSNLRGMGQPILGNAVQGAPLFPLNLVLLPLPDQAYWTIMPISRIVLICLGAFLIARKIIGLSFSASLFFALLIGFNTNTVRWMNHPWTNGLLAGLWYFYFLCRVCLSTTQTSAERPKLGWLCIGLIISVFAMVTSGFPEATVMSAIIVAILYLGFAITHWPALKPQLSRIIGLIVICHLIGFALSSIQIFALLEFIHEGGAMEQRLGFAGNSYKPGDLLPYTLAQLSIFGDSKEHQSLLNFSLGFWGLFFAIRGAVAIVTGSLKRSSGASHSAFAIAFLVCMCLFLAKAFGLSELVNKVFLSTPILAESHFPLYFSPLLYIGFAFFAAIGFSELLSTQKHSEIDKLISVLSSVVAIAAVIALSSMAIERFHGIESVSDSLFSRPELLSLRIFILASVIITLVQIVKVTELFDKFSLAKPLAWSLSIIILALSVIETSNTVPKNFSPIGLVSSSINQETINAVYQAYAAAPLPQHELRGTNLYGDFVGQGLATVDNGASAILTPEYRILRRALFNVPYGGYRPLEKPYGNWSYHAMSANILAVHATPKSNPSWQAYTAEPEIDSRLTSWPNTTLVLSNPFFLQGRSLASVKEYRGVNIWLHFEAHNPSEQTISKSDDFWIEANIGGQHRGDIIDNRQTIDTRWRIRVPAEWFINDTYTVTLRQLDPYTGGFHDATPVSLRLDRTHADAVRGTRLKLLSSSSDNARHFFLDEDSLPRAYIASACDLAQTIEQEIDFYRRDNSIIKGKVIFPYDGPLPTISCDSYSANFKRVAIVEDRQSSLSFEPIQGPALLLLNDSDYPGWRAFDQENEAELPIQRANTNGRSVYLPEARLYKIEMSYTPVWLPWVYGLLALAAILLLGLYRMVWKKGNA